MTKTPNEGGQLSLKKLSNALLYAKAGGAQTAILTSKGETLSGIGWTVLSDILYLCKLDGKLGQRDLHTNASLILQSEKSFYTYLVSPHFGFTNITITVASLNKEVNKNLMGIDINYKKLFKVLKQMGLHIRLSCVLNNEGVKDYRSMREYIYKAIDLEVDSIVFRGLWIPDNFRYASMAKWCEKNRVSVNVARDVLDQMEKEDNDAREILTLPWGETVYEIEDSGLQVVTATCTVNKYKTGFKSIVYLPNNHLYTGWDSKASKIM
jgi:hypothetical protein